MKQALAELWQQVFDDSPAFVDLFFSRVYRPENAFVASEQGRPVAALYVVPYSFTFASAVVTVGYLCGVGTHPSHRGKGHMSQLMQQALNEMRRRNYLFTLLIPASESLFDLYARFGYDTIARRTDIALDARPHAAQPPVSLQPITAQLLPRAYDIYNSLQHKHPCALLHSRHDFETVWHDCRLDGGNAWIIYRDPIPIPRGLIFAIPDSEKHHLVVKELAYADEMLRLPALARLMDAADCRTATVRTPTHSDAATPYAMIQLLDPARVLRLCATAPRTDPLAQAPSLDAVKHHLAHKAFINLMLD